MNHTLSIATEALACGLIFGLTFVKLASCTFVFICLVFLPSTVCLPMLVKGDPRMIKAAHDAVALASGHGAAPVRERVSPGRGGKACSSDGRTARFAVPAGSSAKFG